MKAFASIFLFSLLTYAKSPLTPVVPTAANAWIKVPSADNLPDTVSPEIRKLRDENFDKGLASPVPITPENAGSYHIAEGSYLNLTGKPLGGIKEFPAIPNRCVVIATFNGYKSFLSASSHSVYTEISLSVNYVFESSGISLAPGSSITTAILGGTVRLSHGEVISLLTEPKKFSLEPAKEYLLVLEYRPKTQLFDVENQWAIVNRVVQANSRIEERRASLGLSTVIGRSKEQGDSNRAVGTLPSSKQVGASIYAQPYRRVAVFRNHVGFKSLV